MSQFERVDAVVIGAGVVGLAVARALALEGREVIVLEGQRVVGGGISSRNSEVIHAGLYYPPGSLKGVLCVAGRDALYRYCEEHGVAHRRIGKLVVGCDDNEIDALLAIRETAARTGAGDLKLLDRADVRAMEPELSCRAALLSPATGIIDVHQLMLAYQADVEGNGGMVALGVSVSGGEVMPDGIRIDVGIDEGYSLLARTVVNCAGLDAQSVAASIRGLRPASIPQLHLAKGNYFRLAEKSPFAHLVYPLPSGGGAGVHLTLDLGGQARFGPDVEWIESADYSVDASRGPLFEAAIRRYWPGLPDNALVPDYCGIRPKLHPPGSVYSDFAISDAKAHGAPGLINLYGIESPGLTASLAIGAYVARLAEEGPPNAGGSILSSVEHCRGTSQ